MQSLSQRLLFSLLLVCVGVSLSNAASKQYIAPESAITFADSAQTPSATMTLTGLTTGAGRISARYDRGAGAHAGQYKWRCTFQVGSTVTVGALAEVYLSTSDGTHPDGEIGTADAALTSDKRNNLVALGVVVADQTASNTDMTASGLVYVPDRYISMGVYNLYGVSFRSSTTTNMCSLTPVPPEMQ